MPLSVADVAGRPRKKKKPLKTVVTVGAGGLLRPGSSNQSRGPGVEFVEPDDGKRPFDSQRLVVDWPAIAAAYVDGSVADDKKNGGFKRVFPTYKELEARFGVSVSTIAHRCKVEKWGERRVAINQQMIAEVDKELAKRRALDISDIIGNLDSYLEEFHKAVKSRKLRPETIAEYDKALRLKVYAQNELRARESGAGIITIEQLQDRHAKMRERSKALAELASGYVPGRTEREADGEIEQAAQVRAEQKVAAAESKAHAQATRAEGHLAALGSARQALRERAGAGRVSRFNERAARMSKLDAWGKALFLTAHLRKGTG